jgi:hypothetical protein
MSEAKKALIVGQSARPGDDVPWHMDGHSASKLCRWFAVDSCSELHEEFLCANVARYVGQGAKGDLFKLDAEMVREAKGLATLARRVFLVGKVAQRAFGFKEPFATWRSGKYVGLPHPSGVNVQLNSLPDKDIAAFVKECLSA